MTNERDGCFDITTVEKWRQRMSLLGSEYALDQPLVVVVGSGLSLDRDNRTGVADVTTLVDWIRAERIQVPAGTDQDQYQSAIKALKEQRGARAVSLLIRRAILEAYRGSSSLVQAALGAPSDAQRNACRQLEQELDDWPLPRGVYRLAHWVQNIVGERQKRPNPSVGPIHVVTANFDPLIEIALKRFRVHVAAHSIPHDANPMVAACQVCVWHVHGAWWDVTLHSPAALSSHREVLLRALQNWMKDAQICILGYGGWQDVVSTTVADTLGTVFGGAEVLWAFFEDSDRKILDKYRDPLERLASAPAFSQTTLFHGVDLHGMNWGEPLDVCGAPNVCAFPGSPVVEGISLRVSDDLLERLRVAIEDLLKAAPNHAKTKLGTLLKFDDILPDLCVVLAELCLTLKPITAKDQRRLFALTVLEVISALSACILKVGPREPVARSERDKELVVESALMAELWVAATEWRALRVKRVVGQKKVIIRPAELAVDVDESAMLEWGPSETDYVRAFESRFWETLCPDAETYEQSRDSADLNGKLRARKLLHQPLIGLVSQKGPIPVDVLRGSFPHARFFIREASGASSCPIDEHTLAALLEELLTIAPELSPDVASTKESLL